MKTNTVRRFLVKELKRTKTCRCGNKIKRFEHEVRLGSVGVCAKCLDEAIHHITIRQHLSYGTPKWVVKEAGRQVTCKRCSTKLIRGTFHAHTFGQQAFSETYCLDCVKQMYKELQEYTPEQFDEKELEKLLIKLRYGL